MKPPYARKPSSGWRSTVHEIVFEADTQAGKLFDVILLWLILASVAVVLLESVASIRSEYGGILRGMEWTFTVLFTIEYITRLACIGRPLRYAASFFGLVDLIAILPAYMGLFIEGAQLFMVLRSVRLLRAFRIFKLARYLGEAKLLMQALRASRPKISVFLGGVLVIVVIVGALMYVIEGDQSGFTSIPRSIYWAIVTLTTVGYGDIAPRTTIGQILAASLMVLGYGILAVPTGVVSVELAQAAKKTERTVSTQACPACGAEGHDPDALYCKHCGTKL